MLDAVLLLAAAGAGPFQPPLGVPFAYVSSEDRTAGGTTLHFESRRRITFVRDGDGFVATIVFAKASDDAGGDVAAMFQTALASLADAAVTLHLDRQGEVVGVDDADQVWAALCDAVAALPGDRGQRARASAFAAALRALPSAQRRDMLGSLLAPIVAGADAALVPGTVKPVTLNARPPAAAGASLAGTQTVTRDHAGTLDVHVFAAGDVAATGGATAHVTITRDRVIDPETGLVLAIRDHRVTTIGSDRVTADTNVTLTAPVS